MQVLVTGGTGGLGRALVPRLADAGHEVRVLTRRSMPKLPTGVAPAHGDVLDRPSLLRAMHGVDAVVHAATSPRRDVHRIEVEGTRHVVEAAEASLVQHLLYVSIVGIDDHPFPYYRAKHAAEAVVSAAGVPWTIQRATQFHHTVEYVLAGLSRTPFVLPVPRGMRLQPVDVGEVADRFAELLDGKAAGRVQDLGGPEVLAAEELARTWAAARGHRRRIVTLPVPGKAAAAFRAGSALCTGCLTGTRTWQDHLDRAR